MMNGLGLSSYKFNAFHTVVLKINLLVTVWKALKKRIF